MDSVAQIVKFFQDGGAFMYPILAVMVLGIAIAIERSFFLTRAAGENRSMWKRLSDLVAKGDLAMAQKVAEDSKTAVGRIFVGGLSRARAGATRSDIEMALEESLMVVMPMFEKRTHYLSTLANVATLLGLLGTVVGMIGGFTAISAANPAEKVSLLSAAISVAMNCTAFGLIAAIPMLLLHSWLSTRANEMVDALEAASVRMLNTLTARTAG
jgi:biopolymer transport protein ExbB/TolQ